jgi:hypothetical protein
MEYFEQYDHESTKRRRRELHMMEKIYQNPYLHSAKGCCNVTNENSLADINKYVHIS